MYKYKDRENRRMCFNAMRFSATRCVLCAMLFYPIPYTLCTIRCYAAPGAKSVKMGNIMYKKGKFDEALKYYNKAKIASQSPVIDFDIGASLYKKKEYKKAIYVFNNALTASDANLESKINYNIANARYRMGKRSINTNPGEAIKFYRQALDYYKRSIELDSKNINAKYNHEFVERELKILLDKLKKQHSQKTSSGKNKENQNKSKASKAKISSSNQNKKQNASKSQTEEKKAHGITKKKASVNKEQQLQSKAYKAGKENSKEMSKEEARMILDRYNQEEESPRNIDKNTRGVYYPPVLKDW